MGFQNWATPPAFIEWCEREVLPTYGYDRFGLDACAEPHNAKAPRFLAPVGCYDYHAQGLTAFDGLNASWANYGAVWCNPGFSACREWLRKARHEREASDVTSLNLSHLTTTAKWYHENKRIADRWIIPQRIHFLPPEGVVPSSNNRDSLLWVHSPLATGRIFEPDNWRA